MTRVALLGSVVILHVPSTNVQNSDDTPQRSTSGKQQNVLDQAAAPGAEIVHMGQNDVTTLSCTPERMMPRHARVFTGTHASRSRDALYGVAECRALGVVAAPLFGDHAF